MGQTSTVGTISVTLNMELFQLMSFPTEGTSIVGHGVVMVRMSDSNDPHLWNLHLGPSFQTG